MATTVDTSTNPATHANGPRGDVSPLKVAQAFVKKFYSHLHEQPELIPRFFKKQSAFSIATEGVGEPYADTVEGPENISKQLRLLDVEARNSTFQIKTIDSQKTAFQGTILVMVLGTQTFTAEDRAPRKFVQVFHIAQSVKGVYIANSIFRYLQSEPAVAEHTAETADHVSPAANGIVPEQKAQASKPESTQPPAQKPQTPAAAPAPAPAPVAAPAPTPAPAKPAEQPAPKQAAPPAAAPASAPAKPAEQPAAKPAPEKRQPAKPAAAPAAAPPKPTGPLSWAQRLVQESGAKPATAPAAATGAPAATTAPVATTPAQGPAPAATGAPTVQSQGPAVSETITAASPAEGRSPRPGKVPNNQTLVITSFPPSLTRDDLLSQFDKFGPIHSVDVRKVIAFVDFKAPASVQKALKAHQESPIVINKVTLDIEEKKILAKSQRIPKAAKGDGERRGGGGGGGTPKKEKRPRPAGGAGSAEK